MSRDRLDHIVQRLDALRPVRILLFGSSARGDGDAFSDLDLIVSQKTSPSAFWTAPPSPMTLSSPASRWIS